MACAAGAVLAPVAGAAPTAYNTHDITADPSYVAEPATPISCTFVKVAPLATGASTAPAAHATTTP